MTDFKPMNCFIAAADLHIHNKVPKNRKGNYYNQVMTKFEHLLRITRRKSDNNILVVAGDFFDSPQVPYKVARLVLEVIQEYETNILVVPGQHDLRYHVSGLDNTPLGVLETAKAVTILKPKDNKVSFGGVSFVGAGWNEEPEEKADVLVMHRMVTKKGELWPGQTNYSTAHAIMRKYPWADCILTGDNHLPHALRIKGGKENFSDHRLQVNCGSLVRSTKTQINFQPRCWIIDIHNWKAGPVKIPIEPAKDVFDFAQITIEEMKKESKEVAAAKIAEFVDTLPQDQKEKPNFKKILKNIVDQIEPKDSVKTIIRETMERIS